MTVTTTMTTAPCDCASCVADPYLLTGVGEHSYRLETRNDPGEPTAWRWACACGGQGRWQCQSDNAAYHSWRRHARLERP